MGPTLLCELGLFLLCTLLCTGHAQDAELTIAPNWSSFLIGEFVTFICDMNEGADADWEYKLNKDGREFVPYSTYKYYILEITSTGYSGEYQCCGHWKSSRYTKSSNVVSIIVSDKPRATLTAGATIIPVGGSVTLTCSVGSSAEWKYEWFRHTQRTTEVQIRRDDQPNRDIRVSQGGIYSCRGGRGNPVFNTDISDEVSIEIIISNKVAVKQQQHNWPQIFSGETITLTCEVQEGGEPTEWEYGWRGPRQTTQWTHNNSLTFRVSESSSGGYMCKSRLRDDSYSSTEWSEAFTLSASTDQPKAQISSDVRDSPVGGSVTLSCSVNQSSGWKYYWYRYDKSSEPLTTQDAFFSSDGQISVSQEGLYCCRGGRGDPVYYTEYSHPLSIDKNIAPGTESTSFLTPLIVGLVCGVLLIFLFLLLRHFTKSKDSHLISGTGSTNQSSATNHMINQNEAQHSQHTFPLQDDSVLYAQVSYNKAKAKRAKEKSAPAAAEETVYSEVKLHTALDDSLLYAQVSYNKAKAKRDKGRSAPAAADETIYAEVKPQTAVGDCTEIIL